MRALDEKVVTDALAAFLETHRWIARIEKTEGSKLGYQGRTADRVLHDAGIRWGRDRHEYQRYEREVRHRARQVLGGRVSSQQRTEAA